MLRRVSSHQAALSEDMNYGKRTCFQLEVRMNFVSQILIIREET